MQSVHCAKDGRSVYTDKTYTNCEETAHIIHTFMLQPRSAHRVGIMPQEDTAEPDFALEIWSEGRSARLNSSLNLLEKIAKNGHRKASCHRLSWRNLQVPHVEHLQTQYAQSLASGT